MVMALALEAEVEVEQKLDQVGVLVKGSGYGSNDGGFGGGRPRKN
ncbi:hypothetical protein Tco_0634351, partial [Tanacetum coccineum]